jgi:hypothetical protein
MYNPYDGSQLCAQTDRDLFFPENLHAKPEIKQAIAVCKRCPLLKACKDYADTHTGLYGVWAGKMYDGSGYVSPLSIYKPTKVA